MLKLGELVREKRREYNMTQEDLAKKVGVTQNYIAKIEIGYQAAGLKTLYKLSEVLKIPEEEIINLDVEFLAVLNSIADKQGKYSKAFSKLAPRVKSMLLELAPIVEKYV